MSELFGRIVLERKSEFLNRLKGYGVEINGAMQEKKITNGSSEEYEVPGGANVITCKVNWCSSMPLTVDIKPGETVYLKVASGMKYFWAVYGVFLVALLGRLFLREKMTPEMNMAALAIFLVVIIYFGYYLTLGRKHYLKVEQDVNNIFAK
ncbi:hypothetical protein [Ferruginibacter profundus]